MKKTKMRALWFLCAFFVFSFVLNAKEKNEIILGYAKNPLITMTSIVGKGTADAQELFSKLSDEMGKKYGVKLTLQLYPSPKFLFKAFQDKTADISAMYLSVFLSAKNLGIPVKPFLSYSSSGEKTFKYCVYTHKGSGIKNIQQLKGKRFVTEYPYVNSKKDALLPKESYIYWVIVKKILAQNGVHEPFAKFFKEFWVLPVPDDSVVYSVMLKRFDATYTSNAYLQTLINYDKGFSDLIPLSCMEMPAPPPLVQRMDLDADIAAKIRDYALHPPKTKMGKELQGEFKGIKFIPVEEKDYALYFQWLKEAEKKGWNKEFDEIMAKVMKESKEKGKSKYIYKGEK